jgi:O-Antigen ligase
VRRLRGLGGNPEVLLGLLAVGVFVAWAAADGGFEPISWYPGALFLLGLLVVAAIVYRGQRLPRLNLLALGCLGAFVLWCFLSIAWAGVEGDAWDGANRTLLYFTVFALFALPLWRASSAALLFGVYSVAIAVVGAVSVVDAASAEEPVLFFIQGRFTDPIGYHNGTAALFLGAFFPALFLASRAETPWLARPVLLAAAGLLAELALLPQSRGSAIAFPIALVIYLVIVPDRVRSALVLVPVAAAVALTAGPILDLYDVALSDGDLAGALDSAESAMAISVGALLVVGTTVALADRRVEVPESTARVAERGVGFAGAVLGVAAIVVAIPAIGNPVSWAEDRWTDFKSGYSEAGFGSSRFSGSLGSNRYDFWRVALDEFTESPATGIGTDNFAVEYLAERHSGEESDQPHSLPVRVLSQTGIVGAGLFVGFLAFALAAAIRVRRCARSPAGRAVAGMAIATFAYWFVHSSGDWFWAIPGLTAPAFAWLAIAGRVDGDADSIRPSGGASVRMPSSLGAGVVGALIALVAAASYLGPWGAARDIDEAASIWDIDPQGAYDRLDRARDLNPLSEDADLLNGAIAGRLGDRERMRAAYTMALDRNPRSWYALFELGALDAVEGDRSAAVARLTEAQQLNPSEPLIPRVLRGAKSGTPASLRSIDRRFIARVCGLVGRTEDTRYCE